MMNVVSLFHGMGCINLALNDAEIKANNVYCSEVNKFAIKEDQANHSNNVHLGTVEGWREWSIDWASIDLIVGGSPCQGFSSAGKKGGTSAILNGKKITVESRGMYKIFKYLGAEFLSQSYLFWEYVLCVDHVLESNPKAKFFLENVRMTQNNLDMITNALNVEPVFINSKLVTAQNRQRFYWTNINWLEGTPVFNKWITKFKDSGGDRALYDKLYPPHIEQPEDLGILLRDIIETEGVGVLKLHGEIKEKSDKANCIDANYHKGIDNHGQRTAIAMTYKRKEGLKGEIEKSQPLNASDWRGLNRNQNQTAVVSFEEWIKDTEAHGGTREEYDALTYDPKIAAMRGRYTDENGVRNDTSENKKRAVQRLEVNHTRRSNALTTVSKDNCLLTENGIKNYYKVNEINYRKLTVIECCRLQGVPDDFFKASSNSQAYKMLGNGWTVPVISHFLKYLKQEQQQKAWCSLLIAA